MFFQPCTEEMKVDILRRITMLLDSAIKNKQPIRAEYEVGIREAEPSADGHERKEPDGSWSVLLQGVRRL